MTWWGNPFDKNSKELKRKSRFLIETGTGLFVSAKSAKKPAVNIESKEYRMINHYYNYPGIAKWEPISITFADIGNFEQKLVDTNAQSGVFTNEKPVQTSEAFWEMLLASGYSTPDGQTGLSKRAKSISSPEKASTIDNSFGKFLKIHQLDSNGKKTETWELYNPIITKLSWGDLSYEDDGAVEFTMDIKYDWAVLLNGEDDSKNNAVESDRELE